MAAKASQNNPSLSQELDARFSVFLNPIRDLTKNWEVDIAKYLEEYLEELAEVKLSLDGGVTTMNFAEAAMLIQGSVTVYSKKVDFLWQMVLKTLDLLSNRRTLEGTGENLELGGAGGGRKNRLDLSISFSRVDNIQVSRNIELREDDDDLDQDSRRKSVKFLPATPLNLVEKEIEKSNNRISLRVKNNEVLGAKDDFRLTRSYLTPSGSLHLEVPEEMLGGGPAPDSQADAEAKGAAGDPPLPQEGGHSAAAQDHGEAEKEDIGDDDVPLDLELPPDDPPSPAEDPLPPVEDPVPPTEDPVPPTEDPAPRAEDPDPPLPIEDPKDPPNNNNNNNNNNNLTVIDLPNGRYGLRKRNKDDKEVVNKLKLTEKLKPFDPNADCPPKRPPRAGRLRVPTPCPCHRPTETKRQKNKKNKNKISKTYSPLEEFITGQLKDMIKKSKRERTKEVPPEIIEDTTKEDAHRIDAVKQKVAKKLSQNGVCLDEVVQASQEALALAQDQDQDNDHDDPLGCDAPVDLDLDSPEFVMPEAHPVRQFPAATTSRLNDSVAGEEPASEYEALVQKWVADYVNSAQESIKSSELERRVNKWREDVLPKLQAEEKRTEFDIHSYGSLILSHFPSDGRKQTIAFKQLVAGMGDVREVSRIFLSCLMLANTHNIELSESEPGDLAMDCLELTLKSRVRHHEELEEYAAPSQASNDRLSSRSAGQLGIREQHEVCADITQTTNMQHASNIITKKGGSKKRTLPR